MNMFSKINYLTFENNAYETLQIGCYLSNNCKAFCFITKVNFNENLKFVTVDYPHNSVTPSSACFWVANTGNRLRCTPTHTDPRISIIMSTSKTSSFSIQDQDFVFKQIWSGFRTQVLYRIFHLHFRGRKCKMSSRRGCRGGRWGGTASWTP